MVGACVYGVGTLGQIGFLNLLGLDFDRAWVVLGQRGWGLELDNCFMIFLSINSDYKDKDNLINEISVSIMGSSYFKRVQ